MAPRPRRARDLEESPRIDADRLLVDEFIGPMTVNRLPRRAPTTFEGHGILERRIDALNRALEREGD